MPSTSADAGPPDAPRTAVAHGAAGVGPAGVCGVRRATHARQVAARPLRRAPALDEGARVRGRAGRVRPAPGAPAPIPLMQADAVRRYHWMSGQQFLDAVTLGQVTPGPAVQTVAVVGYAAAGLAVGCSPRRSRSPPPSRSCCSGAPVRPDPRRRARPSLSRRCGAGRHRRDPRLGHPARRGAHAALAVRRARRGRRRAPGAAVGCRADPSRHRCGGSPGRPRRRAATARAGGRPPGRATGRHNPCRCGTGAMTSGGHRDAVRRRSWPAPGASGCAPQLSRPGDGPAAAGAGRGRPSRSGGVRRLRCVHRARTATTGPYRFRARTLAGVGGRVRRCGRARECSAACS